MTNPGSDFDRLHRLNRHFGAGQLAIELFVPLRVATQSGRDSARDDFKNTTNRIAGPQDMVNLGLHFSCFCSLDQCIASERFEVLANVNDFFPRCVPIKAHMADGNRVAQNDRAKLLQKKLGECSCGNTRRCLARRCSLEHIASIVEIKFLRSGEVRVPWTGSR